jgi:hypothetical protein
MGRKPELFLRDSDGKLVDKIDITKVRTFRLFSSLYFILFLTNRLEQFSNAFRILLQLDAHSNSQPYLRLKSI